MARSKYIDIPGQYTLDLSTDTRNYVVQSNELVMMKQGLNVHSAKIVRSVIMQIKKEDDDFKTYNISKEDMCKLLGVSHTNVYKISKAIFEDLNSHPLEFKPKNPKSKKYIGVHWFPTLAYDDDGVGLLVKVNPDLKPYLLQLQGQYTQYQLEDILRMKSIYAIRLYEMLIAESFGRSRGHNGATVELTIEELKHCFDIEDKYDRYSQFKERVLDVAVKEIRENTFYSVTYEEVKKDFGKGYKSIIFHIISLLYKK